MLFMMFLIFPLQPFPVIINNNVDKSINWPVIVGSRKAIKKRASS